MESDIATKKIAAASLAVTIATLTAGYLFAKNAITDCVQDTFQEMKAKNVHGLQYGGEIVPTERIEIFSKVEWPFVVSVYYYVPLGLHSSTHGNRYIVLPWRTIKRPLEAIYYL